MIVVSPAVETPELVLSPDDARRMTLRAQGFLGTEGRRGGVPGMLRRIGAVQLDTISVLARSHELVAYARLGLILGPIWWLFWVGVAMCAVGGVLALATHIFDDWY